MYQYLQWYRFSLRDVFFCINSLALVMTAMIRCFEEVEDLPIALAVYTILLAALFYFDRSFWSIAAQPVEYVNIRAMMIALCVVALAFAICVTLMEASFEIFFLYHRLTS